MGQTGRRFISSNTSSTHIKETRKVDPPAGVQDRQQPEALSDVLIRLSLFAWRTELEAQPPPWSQVRDRIFSNLNEGQNGREFP